MNLPKPMVKTTARGFSAMVLLCGVAMILFGVYFGFFQSRGYEKTTAVITQIEERPDETSADPNAVAHDVTVRYTADGREYTGKLDAWSSSYQPGKEVRIKYDPADPARIHADQPGVAVYLIGVGAVLAAAEVFLYLKNKKQREQLAERQPAGSLLTASRPSAERKLYFLTDLGTAKGGCHIEDEQRNVLYEAVSRHFSLLADSEFEFIDHALGRSVSHMVGKTVTSSSDAFWVLDNHSTFELDGRDIWKQLHENGVRIETGLRGLKWVYSIYREERLIASAEASGQYVHEEDEAEKGLLAKTIRPGFYRIRAYDDNLDAVFLTLFAIGRTDMTTYQ